MVAPSVPHRLTPAQFEQTLQALDRARETFELRPRTLRLYKLLRFSVCTAVGALFAYVPAAFLAVRWEPSPAATAPKAFVPVFGAVSIVLFLAMLSSLVLLLLNLPLVIRIVRQRALLRRLGLRDLSVALWKTQRRKRIWARVWWVLMLTVGVLSLVAAVLALLGTLTTPSAPPYQGDLAFLLIGVGMFVTLGVTTIGLYLVQRGKQQLDLVADASQLRQSLLEMKERTTDGDAIIVPAEAMQSVARMEAAQIARERAEAVVACADTKDRGYGVFIARDVSAQKGTLDLATRMQVEEAIERIGANPHPPEATAEGAEGLWRLRSADGAIQLAYAIDEQQRQVRVLAMNVASAAGPAGRPPGGTSG